MPGHLLGDVLLQTAQVAAGVGVELAGGDLFAQGRFREPANRSLAVVRPAGRLRTGSGRAVVSTGRPALVTRGGPTVVAPVGAVLVAGRGGGAAVVATVGPALVTGGGLAVVAPVGTALVAPASRFVTPLVPALGTALVAAVIPAAVTVVTPATTPVAVAAATGVPPRLRSAALAAVRTPGGRPLTVVTPVPAVPTDAPVRLGAAAAAPPPVADAALVGRPATGTGFARSGAPVRPAGALPGPVPGRPTRSGPPAVDLALVRTGLAPVRPISAGSAASRGGVSGVSATGLGPRRSAASRGRAVVAGTLGPVAALAWAATGLGLRAVTVGTIRDTHRLSLQGCALGGRPVRRRWC